MIHEASLRALHAEVDAFTVSVAAQRHTFAAFHARLVPLWHAKSGGKTHARKPSTGLRLMGENKAILLAATPSYSRYTKQVDCQTTRLEVYTDVKTVLQDGGAIPFHKLTSCFALTVTADAVRYTAYQRGSLPAAEALGLLLEQFLADPQAVLRRSTLRCALCGRFLTDGASRARGFGPECIKVATHLLIAFKDSLGTLLGRVPEDDAVLIREGTP